MNDRADLERTLLRLDGASYPAYRTLTGTWDLDGIALTIDHVQGDPFAAPSRLRVRVRAELHDDLAGDRDRREATEDWLLRRFGQALQGSTRGSGRSGVLRVYLPGPEVVERSAVRIGRDEHGAWIEARFQAGLPARGRRILGRQAIGTLLEDVPRAARALAPGPGVAEHVRSVQEQRALRRALPEHGLIGFVADGAVLPRRSGVSPDPLPDAVPFESPPSLRVTLPTPWGSVSGLGVREGVTLIVGGGFHGKSTLLQALQHGHLDHVPGDGRERVVTVGNAVKVRAEDGRRVAAVDISPFLGELPGGRGTAPFSTDDASGSTSQAAAIVEAVEGGARVLLLDEDTSATNLLVSDTRMRALIPREREPITPLVERVQQLYEAWGVSTVLVVGGVGDYLSAAKVVIAMEDWVPRDVTAQAHALGPEPPTPPGPLAPVRGRRIAREGLEPDRIRARREDRLSYGGDEIDLSAVEQVIDARQAATIGEALRLFWEQLADGRRTLPSLLDALDAILDDEGVEALSPRDYPVGDLVRPRRHEIAAALSRLRTLVAHPGGPA